MCLKQSKTVYNHQRGPPNNNEKGDESNLRSSWPKIITNTPNNAPIHTASKTVTAAERGSKYQEIGVYVAAIVTKIVA